MLTADEAREAVVRDWGRVLVALDALDADGWAGPTRCAGWTLTDIARHAAWGTSMEADAIRRARTGTPGTAEGREPSGGPVEVLPALRAAVAELTAELGHAGDLPADAVLPLPFGDVPAAFGLQVFAMEAGVHADDVVDALGRDEPLGTDVVRATSVVLPPVLPVLASMPAYAAEPAPEGTTVTLTGPTVALRFAVVDGAWTAVDGAVSDEPTPGGAVVGGDDTSVLRFALGRVGADDARLTVTGTASAFKRWIPGP